MSDSGGTAFPPRGRLLGIDYGTVRVGLAVSDPDRIVASPLETFTRQNPTADAAHFARVIAGEVIVGLVVGLPLHADGNESEKSREARDFGGWLGRATGLPVALWDERFTTALADDAFREANLPHKKRRDRRDRVAAQFILQAFLDAGCPPDAVPGVPPADRPG